MTTHFRYDSAGRFGGFQSGAGAQIEYVRDLIGQVVEVRTQPNDTVPAEITQYQYDGVGNITRITDPSAGSPPTHTMRSVASPPAPCPMGSPQGLPTIFATEFARLSTAMPTVRCWFPLPTSEPPRTNPPASPVKMAVSLS